MVMKWMNLCSNGCKLCNVFNLFVSKDFKLMGNGASRVRNGTPRSLSSGLLAPIVPWLQVYLSIYGFTNGINLHHMG